MVVTDDLIFECFVLKLKLKHINDSLNGHQSSLWTWISKYKAQPLLLISGDPSFLMFPRTGLTALKFFLP